MGACVICRSEIQPFVSYGKQPIANGFLAPNQFPNEYFFELEVAFCPTCTMVQLTGQPEREKMFNENYAFFSGTSRHMSVHFGAFAESITTQYLKEEDPFVVEIGSNDGIMLKHFAARGVRHLGVEPSANVAEAARANGVNTLNRFFDAETARLIVAENGRADAFLAANVMCHIPYLHSVIEGMEVLLEPAGVVAFEDPYLGDVVEKTSYDQVYDEHMFLFSVSSIEYLFGQHGFELIDVVPQPTHGGSMRYILARKGARPVSPRVAAQKQVEERQGLARAATFERFRRNCEKSRDDLVKLLRDLKAQRKRVVGYAATSKSTTVLNYCQIGPDLIEYISDSTPIKQGKFTPGMHIPVVAPERFHAEPPDYAVLFGWNHKTEILEKEKAFTANGGKWIVFVPSVGVLT
jgi:methylation protein EvaC